MQIHIHIRYIVKHSHTHTHIHQMIITDNRCKARAIDLCVSSESKSKVYKLITNKNICINNIYHRSPEQAYIYKIYIVQFVVAN